MGAIQVGVFVFRARRLDDLWTVVLCWGRRAARLLARSTAHPSVRWDSCAVRSFRRSFIRFFQHILHTGISIRLAREKSNLPISLHASV